MSIRNLDALFRPDAVAVIGASESPGSLGRLVTENLRAGFAGPVYAVNPRHDTILGAPAYASVAALPAAPALAVIVTPPPTVPGIVAALADRGTRGAVVITAGVNDRADAPLREQ
ncbi:MAG: CoA-binding protein, partial [Gammaproteobacteria bacterium]